MEPGQVIGDRYRILEPLGEGVSGRVFLAEHVMIHRRVAVKVLHPQLSNDDLMVKRFLNEARAAGMLGHPNIVEALDMGVTPDLRMYIVFEYIAGTLLSDEIANVGGMPLERALRIADQIASALTAAHDAGIVHRDLKSQNVFLSTRGDVADHVTVIDFGVSRFLQASHVTGGTGLLVGTLDNISPEQITAPESVDHRADIYAFGIVLYELLAGHLPFHQGPADSLEQAHEMLLHIVAHPPPPFGRLDTPLGLQEMVFEKLLAKEPARRFQSMGQVRRALAAFVSDMQVTADAIANDAAAMLDSLDEPPRSQLDPAWLAAEVAELGPRWSLHADGVRLELAAPMARCALVVTACAEIGDALAHHPHITLDGEHLRLVTFTRRVGAITKLDLWFAAQLETWLREHDF